MLRPSATRWSRHRLTSLLLDPKVFNYIILVLYSLNALRWAVEGKWADVAYWSGAFWITAAVTFGYGH
jgi:hypothetical protein